MKSIAKSCCCTLAALATLFGMAATPPASAKASFKSEMVLLPGEVWWGGGGGDGQNQPYGLKDSRRINQRRSGATASPLLVSSAGRYVWSEKPFEYQFAKGTLHLDSRVERIEPIVAGKTLKGAYLAAAKAHFRFDGKTPLIWTANFVSPDSREYKKLRYHRKPDGLDYLIHVDRPGSHDAAVFRWWSGISAVYDLTNPKANAYYAQTLKDFAAKYGIAGYKFDAGGAHYFETGCRMFEGVV